jgi:hypothetical protein
MQTTRRVYQKLDRSRGFRDRVNEADSVGMDKFVKDRQRVQLPKQHIGAANSYRPDTEKINCTSIPDLSLF